MLSIPSSGLEDYIEEILSSLNRRKKAMKGPMRVPLRLNLDPWTLNYGAACGLAETHSILDTKRKA